MGLDGGNLHLNLKVWKGQRSKMKIALSILRMRPTQAAHPKCAETICETLVALIPGIVGGAVCPTAVPTLYSGTWCGVGVPKRKTPLAPAKSTIPVVGMDLPVGKNFPRVDLRKDRKRGHHGGQEHGQIHVFNRGKLWPFSAGGENRAGAKGPWRHTSVVDRRPNLCGAINGGCKCCGRN